MKALIQVLQKHYAIQAMSIDPLISYSDSNFIVRDQNKKKYILKILQLPLRQRFEIQCEVLEYLKTFPIRVPEVVKSRENTPLVSINWNGEPVFILLLTFIPGKFLGDIQPWSESLMFKFGHFIGNLDRIMINYRGRRDFPDNFEWDMTNLPDYRNLLHYVENPAQNRLIHYYILQFEDHVRPLFPNLDKLVIHNDANPFNILVEDNFIKGIIDFGDLIYAPRIFNVAVALAYILFRDTGDFRFAVSFIRGYHDQVKLSETEIDLLYYLVAGRLCMSLCLSSKMAYLDPQNDYTQLDRDKAWNLLRQWVTLNPIAFATSKRNACGMETVPQMNISEISNRRSRYISENLSTSYDHPIYMTRASMQYMYDDRGNTYLDCVNNISHVGHCHPVVVEAGRKQMNRLNTNTRYYYDSLYKYADKLISTFPSRLNKIFFVNSGSAATDLAIRMARIHTQSDIIAVLDSAYHGNTLTGVDISPYKYKGRGGTGPKDNIIELEMPDIYRGKYRLEGAGKLYAEEAKEQLSHEFKGAFIAESLPGCGGQIVLPPGYLQEMYQTIQAQGGICIADEVQVGFGRVGEYFWGFELYDVIPDIVILGKPMGNGHPMGAVVCTDDICSSFENGMEFFSSFGGNPVSCEIGKAVLEVIHQEQLQNHAFSLGNYILEQWHCLRDEYGIIGDVRGKGLFLGMEIVKSKESREPDSGKAHELVEEMKKRFILLSTDGSDRNVIKFKPPMVFDQSNADILNHHLNEVLTRIQ